MDITRLVNALNTATAARKKEKKFQDMQVIAQFHSGRMGLEAGQKLNHVEAMREYREAARKAGKSFQDKFEAVGGKDTLIVLKDILGK